MLELHHAEGIATVEDLPDGRRRVNVTPAKSDAFISRRSAETSYPVPLIEAVLEAKGIDFVCDELAREEDERYLRLELERSMLPYVPAKDWAGKSVLDFGCGAGASTLTLARMFPETTITGVELEESNVRLARARAAHYGVRARFLVSPRPDALPDELGAYDFVVLSAVYEHLLPAERGTVLPLVWGRLKPGGVLFLNQTPYRYWHKEGHTTGLRFINFLPDRLAFAYARHASKRSRRDHTWEGFLRYGIRGATIPEIMGVLRRAGARAELLKGAAPLRDPVDMWYAMGRPKAVRRAAWAVVKAANALTGLAVCPVIAIALRKN